MTRFFTSLLLLVLLSGTSVLAQTTPTTGTPIRGYMYEVKPALANKRVFICGQQPVDDQGNLVGRGDLNAQTKQVLKNIRSELAKNGLTLKDVKQVSYRVKDYTANANAALSAANLSFSELLPGITDYSSVSSFLRDGMILEIEVVAVR